MNKEQKLIDKSTNDVKVTPSIQESKKIKDSEDEEIRLKIEKRKEIKKNAISLLSLFLMLLITTLGITYCFQYEISKNKDKNGNPLKRTVATQSIGIYDSVKFRECFNYKFIDHVSYQVFKPEYINFVVNNETCEVEDFAILDARNFDKKHVGVQMFDLHTGDLVCYQHISEDFIDLLEPEWWPEDYYNYLRENCTIIPISEAGEYIDGDFELKDGYTIEEITKISNQVKEGFEKIKEAGLLVLN